MIAAAAFGAVLEMSVTAYGIGCDAPGPFTSSGTRPRARWTVAADPRVLPAGSEVHVEGLGRRRVEDTGPAIKGLELDLFMLDCRDAIDWGRRTRRAAVLFVPGQVAGLEAPRLRPAAAQVSPPLEYPGRDEPPSADLLKVAGFIALLIAALLLADYLFVMERQRPPAKLPPAPRRSSGGPITWTTPRTWTPTELLPAAVLNGTERPRAQAVGRFPGEPPRCSTCQLPATTMARDVVHSERWDTGAPTFEAAPGPTKFGCDRHPVKSETIERPTWSPLVAVGGHVDEELGQCEACGCPRLARMEFAPGGLAAEPAARIAGVFCQNAACPRWLKETVRA